MSDTTLPPTSPTLVPAPATIDFIASPARRALDVTRGSRIVRAGGVFVPLDHYAVIDAEGPDARTFLHNQLTNDVANIGTDKAAIAALCSAKGRMLASFLYWATPSAPLGADTGGKPAEDSTVSDDQHRFPDIRLILARDIGEAIRKRLQMFVLRAKVKLHDGLPKVALFGLAAPLHDAAFQARWAQLRANAADAADTGTAETWALPSDSHAVTRAGDAVAIRLPDAMGQQRYLLCVPASQAGWATALSQTFGEISAAQWDWLDIGSGFPHIAAATQDAFVPQMINFEAIGGVNFRKGCYPGQEVVARSQYRGTVKRRATRAHAANAFAGNEIVDLSDPANQGAPETWQPCGHVVNVAAAPDGGVDCLIELKLATPAAAVLHVVLKPLAALAANETPEGTPETVPLEVIGLPYALPDLNA